MKYYVLFEELFDRDDEDSGTHVVAEFIEAQTPEEAVERACLGCNNNLGDMIEEIADRIGAELVDGDVVHIDEDGTDGILKFPGGQTYRLTLQELIAREFNDPATTNGRFVGVFDATNLAPSLLKARAATTPKE